MTWAAWVSLSSATPSVARMYTPKTVVNWEKYLEPSTSAG